MQYTVIVCIDFLFGKPFRNDILDSVFIAHLVEIMKSSPPSLQEKAATVLEFVALTDPTLAPIIFLDIESGLNSAFQQKILKISGKQFLLCNVCSVISTYSFHLFGMFLIFSCGCISKCEEFFSCYKYIFFSSICHFLVSVQVS